MANNNRYQPRPATNDRNNVYADRNGNIYQRDNKGNWNQRDNQNRSWNPTSRESNPSVNNMNRESQMRERGTTRTNNYNQYRSSGGNMNRGGGGMGHGGGGGRRR